MIIVIVKNQPIYLVFQSNITKLFVQMKFIAYFSNRKLSNNENNQRRSFRSAMYNRYLWIRAALIHRSLHKIVEYIVNNSS
jgi:hypothetical protein